MAKRTWWQRPKLRIDEETDRERKATWLELFFDLYFVVVIAELAHHLAAHP
ncbi:MAG: low temperature requirement protein A [Leptolyngbya sp. RL_3_1]|nr:low temperature requirement protein A [Leptolyngbya sp. RL_3_1]